MKPRYILVALTYAAVFAIGVFAFQGYSRAASTSDMHVAQVGAAGDTVTVSQGVHGDPFLLCYGCYYFRPQPKTTVVVVVVFVRQYHWDLWWQDYWCHCPNDWKYSHQFHTRCYNYCYGPQYQYWH